MAATARCVHGAREAEAELPVTVSIAASVVFSFIFFLLTAEEADQWLDSEKINTRYLLRLKVMTVHGRIPKKM